MRMIWKKILVIALAAMMLFSSFACETIEEAGIIPGANNSTSSGQLEQPEMNDDPTDDFVVNVVITNDGETYKKFPILECAVVWRDAYNGDVFSAPLDENGQARIDGLDGDYYVSLTRLPLGYAYNPNENVTTNDERTINIEVFKLIEAFDTKTATDGTGQYGLHSISKAGVYTVTVYSASQRVYYSYAPTEPGEFSVESWANVAEDYLNPFLDAYGGTFANNWYEETKNDGGTSGSYTANFKHTVQIDDSNFGPGGQATFIFALGAEQRNDKYPITITFAVKKDGEFDYDMVNPEGGESGSSIVTPTFDFSDYDVNDHEYGNKPYKYLEQPNGNNYVFNGSDDVVRLYKKELGGDGFYHVYNATKYGSTNGFGPILYAAIANPQSGKSSALRFQPNTGFNTIEYGGSLDKLEIVNKELTFGKYNYKFFIEGYYQLAQYGFQMNGAPVGSYYCVEECFCHNNQISEDLVEWACKAVCEDCHPDCMQVPDDQYRKKGYADYANSQGLVPVTEELQLFLSRYAKKQGWCNDGTNLLSYGGKKYDSINDGLWLFACCYFE